MKKLFCFLVAPALVLCLATLACARFERAQPLNEPSGSLDAPSVSLDDIAITLSRPFGVTVNCDLKAAIKDAKFDTLDPENPPVIFYEDDCRVGKVEVFLFSYHKDKLSTSEILALIEQRGFQPANAYELLALGAQYPNLQRADGVIALGSMMRATNFNNLLVVPMLSESEFSFTPGTPRYTHSNGTQFAVIRK